MVVKQKDLPESPGVYIFKSRGQVVYVGKAKNLKKRLANYFSSHATEKGKEIVETADSLEYIVVSNEREALLLEANLIYDNKPKFNVLLKDTRVYPYLIFTEDEFPYMKITHDKVKDSIGPFTSVSFLRSLVEIVEPILQIRNCDYDLSRVKRSCIEYGMKRCSAPCVHLISKEEYSKRIEIAKAFFHGDYARLKSWIKEKIDLYSEREMFESASRLKRMYERLEGFFEEQKVEFSEPVDVDVLTVRSNAAVLIKIRNGMMLAKFDFEINGGYADFLEWYYIGKGEKPAPRIVLESTFKGIKKWSKVLSSDVDGARDDDEKKLISIAVQNLEDHLKSAAFVDVSLKRLAELLSLNVSPKFIEGIDISHTHGTFTVASVVTFEDGKPNKKLYRRYKLANFSKIDDFESMRQVVRRRYSQHPLPDLLLIDGGKGQVDAVKDVISKIGKEASIVGLAKSDERIVFPDSREDLHLPLDDGALRILIEIRDEAHRFATAYHYSLRDKSMIESGLDSIPGIGPKRKKALLATFKNFSRIKKASFEELKEILGEKTAKKLEEIIHRENSL
jgi:excinuclease ABC subunit C